MSLGVESLNYTSLQFGHEMKDGNLEQLSLELVGKFVLGLVPLV
jgi:hypothetical protein